MWGLWVCVCPECLLALPHVSCMCREPAQAKLGSGALHRSVSHYEVSIALWTPVHQGIQYLFICSLQSTYDYVSSVLCFCWCLQLLTWRPRAYGSPSRDVCQWNPTPLWRLGDRLISGKLCKFTVIQSKFFIYLRCNWKIKLTEDRFTCWFIIISSNLCI